MTRFGQMSPLWPIFKVLRCIHIGPFYAVSCWVSGKVKYVIYLKRASLLRKTHQCERYFKLSKRNGHALHKIIFYFRPQQLPQLAFLRHDIRIDSSSLQHLSQSAPHGKGYVSVRLINSNQCFSAY